MVVPLIVAGLAAGLIYAGTRKGKADKDDDDEDLRVSEADFTPGSSVPHANNGNVKNATSIVRAGVDTALTVVPGLDDETRESVAELSDSIAEVAPKVGPATKKLKKAKKPKKAKPPKKEKAPREPKPKQAKQPGAGKQNRQAKKAAKKKSGQ